MQLISKSKVHSSKSEVLTGLAPDQVDLSRKKHGANELPRVKQHGLFAQFIENFSDPIIRILLVALAINLVFALQNNGWAESLGIAVAILLATWVSTISMYKSESAFQKLQEEASRMLCRALRAERTVLLPTTEIVVGDLVLLQTGERVPADGELIRGTLDVDQSSLNGEAKEVHKTPGGSGEKARFDHPSQLFSGSMVCGGDGVMRVTAVGSDTFLGKIASEIQEETRESPLKLRLANLAQIISKFGMIGAVLVALADLFNLWVLASGFSIPVMIEMAKVPGFALLTLLHAVTLAVTVVVVAVPEGLPMMITVVLSANMNRMLHDNVLVRKMVGIETAGHISMLFTDKTGTLTQGKLSVACVVRGDGAQFAQGSDIAKDTRYWRLLHTSLSVNNAAGMVEGKPVGGNMTDRALLTFAFIAPAAQPRIQVERTIPFSSDAKYMITVVSGEYNLSLIKGAPERILPHCTKYFGADGETRALIHPEAVESASSAMARQGMRVLAVATSVKPAHSALDFQELALVALVGVRDELRPEAKESIKDLEGAGIQVVMITGDSHDTAQAVARDAGLLNDRARTLSSSEMAKMSDDALAALLPQLRVISRALPSDKSRLVDIAQSGGAIVGMTGDGVNDSPALKKADIGFSMGSGTEVAKEAGDIVILDDNLRSIAKAVLYGRTIFRSIRKFIVFQLTVNVCAVGISIIAPLIGYDAPVTVMQMLWINMVMDTLAGLAFSGEPALKRYLKKKPLKRDEPIVNREMVSQIAVMGAFTSCLCVWFLCSQWTHDFFRPEEGSRILLTAFFAVFMYSGIFNSVSTRTDSLNLMDHILGNKLFVLVMGFVFLVQTCMIYVGGDIMRTYGLTGRELLLCIGLASLTVPADLLRKAITKRRRA